MHRLIRLFFALSAVARGRDPRLLDRRTEAALRAARTDRGARKAIERFREHFEGV